MRSEAARVGLSESSESSRVRGSDVKDGRGEDMVLRMSLIGLMLNPSTNEAVRPFMEAL